MSTPRILFADKSLVAVVKPHLMPSQPDPSGDLSALEWAREQTGLPLLLVNRLDRPVGGLLLLAANQSSAAGLSGQFRERAVKKGYRAIVHGRPEADEARLIHFLRRKARLNKSVVTREKEPGSRRAEVLYRVVTVRGTVSLLELTPLTGRHHQLRAQLSAVGCPVLGDVKYGAKRSLRGRGIALFSSGLELRHPASGQPLRLSCEPEGYPWEIFTSPRVASE